MTSDFTYKICLALIVVICLGLTCLANNDVENRSKYKYGYVIEHKGGSTQAHLESRDGNLALGRYYVNLRNGTGQKVTYFADDLGFHTGVSYSSQNGQGSSKTQIAMGQKAVAAFGNSETQQTPVTASSPTLLFGKKILQVGIDSVTPKPTGFPELNYTPVPGGFYLTHKSVGKSNDTTEHPNYIAGLTSQRFSSDERKQSSVVPQGNINTQTFYSEPNNPSNKINQFQVQFTTPSIKTYTQQGTVFSGTTQFSPKDQTVKISTYTTNINDLSYSKEKSIEKTKFGDIDAQILSEVQKHAEQIIMKDLQKSQNADSNFASLSSVAYGPSTVTMQPIIVTSDGETGLNNIISTTAIPEVVKSSKNLQSGTINSVEITGKNSDQALEDSGYFRVSLSPSLVSSINVSQTPHQSINAKSTDQSPVSNNSMLFEFNLCKKDCRLDLNEIKTKKETDQILEISDGSKSGTNKIVQTFYPENKLHDERHYITTIDVQKSISLDVNQNEAGYIQLAQNYPINKIQPFNQMQKQYNANPTPQTITSNQVSVTPISIAPESNLISTPKQPYILNTVTVAPGLFDVTPNQNLAVLQGLNDISSSPIQYSPPVQDRTGNIYVGYENQLVVPPPPVRLTNDAADDFRQTQDDLIQVEKSIQELRQQILANIDAQHEDEQRKQNLVDEERKQYFENLKKVEALKDQKYYRASVTPQVVQTTASPISTGNVENVEIVPQDQYISAPDVQYETAQQNEQPSAPQATYKQTPETPQAPAQAQYAPIAQAQYAPTAQAQYTPTAQAQYVPPAQTYQTEIKDFTHEVAVPQPPNVPEISSIETYQKQILQSVSGPQQYTLYDNQNPLAVDNNIQQSAQTYTTEKVQLPNYVPQIPIAFQPRFVIPQVTEKPKIVPQLVHQVPAAPPPKVPDSKTFLINPVVPVDYNRFLQIKQPVSLLQTYSVPLASESKIAEIYPVPQQLTFPIQLPQTYKFLAYPDIVSDKYHSTLTQKQNKLRVQPLKPSSPDEDSQRETVQNLLSQPQFHQTYYYPGLPSNSNRLQLRHIRKHQISNSDQVRSQSVIRRGKSLKNLRIEYGFKPPLRPSVEFSEEVKPSIYGPSVQPQ